ncbi:hypothetical protein K491DRAFT_761617 [Lophiostoma macrostomum CBS 122681]|uniref:Uncharacterized protein n=1 Tax=Lophiostoma macrostomum CBS 122681 TaxID=1314788 RepID=A0A6A6SU84_9PLEO|nr:hypothetical protein K491DRAFT_761617 [Lophiostoma macrostomum CBS 122681]
MPSASIENAKDMSPPPPRSSSCPPANRSIGTSLNSQAARRRSQSCPPFRPCISSLGKGFVNIVGQGIRDIRTAHSDRITRVIVEFMGCTTHIISVSTQRDTLKVRLDQSEHERQHSKAVISELPATAPPASILHPRQTLDVSLYAYVVTKTVSRATIDRHVKTALSMGVFVDVQHVRTGKSDDVCGRTALGPMRRMPTASPTSIAPFDTSPESSNPGTIRSVDLPASFASVLSSPTPRATMEEATMEEARMKGARMEEGSIIGPRRQGEVPLG